MVGPTGKRVGGRRAVSAGGVPSFPLSLRGKAARSAAPTSVCSYRTTTGHRELILAERLVIFIAGGVEAGASGCMDLYHDSKFCSQHKANCSANEPLTPVTRPPILLLPVISD